MRYLIGLLLPLLAACTASPQHERELLRLHDAGLKAHLESDLEAFLATQAADFVVVSRGEVSSPSMQERREFFGPYLSATTFEIYKDQIPPIVKVSRDGSLGWVIAQVEGRGTTATSEGGRAPIEFVAAWIELYERRDGRWISIGNASTFKGE